MLKWVETKNAEQTENILISMLLNELGNEMCKSLIGFAQIISTSKNPKCEKCPIPQSCASHFK
jgi:endonuclease III